MCNYLKYNSNYLNLSLSFDHTFLSSGVGRKTMKMDSMYQGMVRE